MTPLIPPLRTSARPRLSEAANIYVETAERKLRENPNHPDALFTLAAWLAILGRPSEAIEHLHRLTRVDPKYPGVWRLKAYVFRQLGDETKARLCERASNLSGD